MGTPSQSNRGDPDAAGVENEFDLSAAALKRSQSVGTLLRQTREDFDRELGQIGAALRISASHLQTIEDGNYEALPGHTYAIGFIRAYAEYLGLDGPEMVRRFKQETEGQGLKHDLSFPVPVSERSVPSNTILLGGVILVLCGYGIWYYTSSDEHGRTEPIPAVPSALLMPPTESAFPAT